MKKTILLVLFYFCYQLVAATLMSFIGVKLALTPTEQTAWALLLSGFAMAIHLILLREVNHREALRPVSFVILCESIGCIFGSMLCFNVLNELCDLPNLLEQQFLDLSHTVSGALSIALVAPIVEELLFRGAIMGHLLKQGHSPRTAILASALVFGVIHLNPAQILFAFCLGCVFGWITWRTRSLLPAVLGHILNNTTGVAEMALTGSDSLLPPDTPEATETLTVLAFAGILLAAVMAWALHRQLRTVDKGQDHP